MRIEYYDADTHDLIRRDAYSQALVDALRERDEARAEVERLNALIHETAAAWIGAELGIPFEGAIDGAMRAAVAEVERLRGELDYCNESPDAAVLRAEGTTLAKMTRDAVGDEPDAHALAVYGYVSKVDQFLTRLRAAPPIVTTATHVQIPRADYERVAHLLDGATPPAVCAVDVEAAAKEIADGFELHLGDDDTRTESLIVAILRKHTRAVEAAAGKIVDDGVTPPMSSGGRDYEVSCVAETLRAAPPSFHLTDIEAASYDVCAANYPGGIDSDRAEEVLRKHTRPLDRERLVRVIREAHASWTGAQERDPWRAASERSADAVLRHLDAQAAQPTQPVEQVIDLTTTLDEARRKLTHLSAADADHLRVIITRNLRPGFALAQPVGPRPEPAKPREGFVVDRDRFNGIANRAGLAVARAIDECIAEIERQRAEFERGGGR